MDNQGTADLKKMRIKSESPRKFYGGRSIAAIHARPR